MGWNRHRIGNPGASDPTPLGEGGAHTRGRWDVAGMTISDLLMSDIHTAYHLVHPLILF